MNIKLQKLDKFFKENHLKCSAQALHHNLNSILLMFPAENSRIHVIHIDDSNLVSGKCIIAQNVSDEDFNLLRLMNRLSSKYRTHSFKIEEDGTLVASYMSLFTDEGFSAELLIDFCMGIDKLVADDMQQLLAVLEKENR